MLCRVSELVSHILQYIKKLYSETLASLQKQLIKSQDVFPLLETKQQNWAGKPHTGTKPVYQCALFIISIELLGLFALVDAGGPRLSPLGPIGFHFHFHVVLGKILS